MLQSAKDLKSFSIRATDGVMGSAESLLFDDQAWGIRYLVVDTGKWLTGRRVLIVPSLIEGIDRATQLVSVRLTRDRVRDSPDVDSDQPVSRQQEIALHSYYGLPSYWAGPGLWAPTMPGGLAARPYTPTVADQRGEAAPDPDESGDPHLRSTKAVTGYHVQASDGEIGHVEDFLFDDREWTIRYCVIDTSNWIGGRRVLIAPSWVRAISWGRGEILVDLRREEIEASPAYDPNTTLERNAEEELHRYYRQPPYWRE
jgi:hypothetical protein